MLADALHTKVGDLVDHLRNTRATPPSLVDIAAVTEVLIGTMQAYFRSIDTEIYREFRNLSDYIARARGEIASLRPSDLKNERLPRAGRELEAIVRSTEDATNTIMAAAEAIMASDPAPAVSERCMEIFEACSFQDITGQRISKVVETLTYIEDRVARLKDALGAEHDAPPPEAPPTGDRALLNGPALEGEGIAQDEVDRLMGTPAPAKPQASQADIDALFD
ncbi:chemotaxis protein [Oleomonas cavernae]|uniref:Chemotaxis protein n=1 Tax=Oleomonas cavernae TaxID=2320859 RepID=A0A418WDJ9_9PROT|nr:protein phosphatase CheZ [Oleomonas cavernae]RJF88103.1 chemotaxis protein [Oleomonas cavernae]